jgi:hypothetical protein
VSGKKRAQYPFSKTKTIGVSIEGEGIWQKSNMYKLYKFIWEVEGKK